MKNLLEWVLLPPGSVLLLGMLGVLLWRRGGRWLAVAGLALLWILSTPYLAWPIIDAAQWPGPPLTEASARQAGAQAVVVLGAGVRRDVPDYGDTLNDHSLLRVRQAARVYRWTGLPLVISGGASRGTPVSVLMAQSLRDEYRVPVSLVESASLDTYQNAVYTRDLLAPHGIDRIILVTEAAHMPRSVSVFEQAGFTVTASATDYVAPSISPYAFTPRLETLARSRLALHELIGRWWYGIRLNAAPTAPAAADAPSDNTGSPERLPVDRG